MSARHSIGALVLLGALAVSAAAQTPATPAQPATPAPAFDVQVITTPAVHAVMLPMKGSYLQHQAAFERLGAFLSGRGVNPTGPIFGRYFSDPSVGEANLVWEVGIPVPAGTTAEAPFEVKDIPATLVAVHTHQGALEELGTAWGSMIQWVMTNGYQPVGPATQVYKGDMAAGPLQVEMQFAVQK